jgi:hypothetical protein
MDPAGGGGYGGQQLDPELIQAILAMQQQQPQQNQMQRQLKMADAMRGDAKGQLAGKQAGGMYMAPNIANFAANLAGNFKAGQMDKDVAGRETAMGQQNSDVMRRYFDALRMRGQQPPQQPQQQQPAMSQQGAMGGYGMDF